MKQHVGAPCTPQVKRRQHVDVGTLIGHSDAKMSADIHSSVSGTVKDIRPIHYSNGGTTTAVVIEPDGEQTLDPTLEVPEVTDYQSLMAAVARAGIVGLGGAGFPTALKMDTDLTNIDLWLVNGAECEPYLSSDCREMVEYPDRIVDAIARCLDLSGVKRSLICVEDNKQEAIGLLRKACERDPRIDVHVLPATYPQGASRVILANVVGKSVPRGGHLTDVGALLFNVTTMSEIGRYLTDGIPLNRRRITCMGGALTRHANLDVAIGTPIDEIIDYLGLAQEPHKVVIGGPMMGVTQSDLESPITKCNSGLLVLDESESRAARTTACIRCDACIDSCPMHLAPIQVQHAWRANDVQRIDALCADLCIECGTCAYVCPANQPLAQSMRLARQMLRAEQRKRRG